MTWVVEAGGADNTQAAPLGDLLSSKVRVVSANVTWGVAGCLWSVAAASEKRREFGIYHDGTNIALWAGGVSSVLGAATISDATVDLTVDYIAGTVLFIVDGVTVFNSTVTTGSSRAKDELFRFFARNGGDFAPTGTRVGNTDIYIDDVLVRSYDFDGSSHGTGVVTVIDTVGANNATGVNMPTDGSAWVDLGGSSGTVQSVTTSEFEQLTQSELVTITALDNLNIIVAESLTQAQLSNLTLDNKISTVITEQKTDFSLHAIANINKLTTAIAEQLTQSTTTDVNDIQLITAVQAQQLSEAILANVTTNGPQDVNAVITEQKTDFPLYAIANINKLTTAITEQLTQSTTTDVNDIQLITAVQAQQLNEVISVNVTTNGPQDVNAVITEQKTDFPLHAIANINKLTTAITEQLTQSTTTDVNDIQLITAVQAQQLNEAISVNVTSSGVQGINVVISEQYTQPQIISPTELQQLQTVITEQLTQVINADIQQSLAANAVTVEQVSQSVIVSVNESSGIFVSVVQTEQLTQVAAANIDVVTLANVVIFEQLTQYSTQQVAVNLTISPLVSEQLTQAQLIAIIESNIANELNIDVDQVTLEILTPTYSIELLTHAHSIELLTPLYTIKHIH